MHARAYQFRIGPLFFGYPKIFITFAVDVVSVVASDCYDTRNEGLRTDL